MSCPRGLWMNMISITRHTAYSLGWKTQDTQQKWDSQTQWTTTNCKDYVLRTSTFRTAHPFIHILSCPWYWTAIVCIMLTVVLCRTRCNIHDDRHTQLSTDKLRCCWSHQCFLLFIRFYTAFGWFIHLGPVYVGNTQCLWQLTVRSIIP